MLYKVKLLKEMRGDNGNKKTVSETYITEDANFAYAGLKVLKYANCRAEVEDVQLLKEYKPPINDYTPGNKVYVIKVAEDFRTDNGDIKTIKYPMPAFADNDNELYATIREFLKQGFSNMRLTTISETKWTWV